MRFLRASLTAVGASVDPAGVTMIDAVKIYGKTKEQFGWPDEPPEEFPSASISNICPSNLNQSNGTGDSDSAVPATTSGTVLERYRHWQALASLARFFILPAEPLSWESQPLITAPSLPCDFQVLTQLLDTRGLLRVQMKPESVLKRRLTPVCLVPSVPSLGVQGLLTTCFSQCYRLGTSLAEIIGKSLPFHSDFIGSSFSVAAPYVVITLWARGCLLQLVAESRASQASLQWPS